MTVRFSYLGDVALQHGRGACRRLCQSIALDDEAAEGGLDEAVGIFGQRCGTRNYRSHIASERNSQLESGRFTEKDGSIDSELHSISDEGEAASTATSKLGNGCDGLSRNVFRIHIRGHTFRKMSRFRIGVS